jgi:peptidoglycan hydrolase-like protein with peptidoglycan-binding domain
MRIATLGILLAATGLLASGCGATRSSAQRGTDLPGQISHLEARLEALEQRQGLIEDKAWDYTEDVSYLKGRIDAVGGGVASAPSVLNEKPTSRRIQSALKQAGFYDGNIDGKVGPRTKEAIRTFQQANGLKVDGKVGPQTWTQLSRYVP